MNETIEMMILHILRNHCGHDNRIRRSEILKILNNRLNVLHDQPIHDRFMRGCIENLRRHDELGAWICSSLDGGYYMAETLDELRGYVLQEEGRAQKILAKTSRQRKVAGLPLSGQMGLE
jgi:hypothetical protein